MKNSSRLQFMAIKAYNKSYLVENYKFYCSATQCANQANLAIWTLIKLALTLEKANTWKKQRFESNRIKTGTVGKANGTETKYKREENER